MSCAALSGLHRSLEIQRLHLCRRQLNEAASEIVRDPPTKPWRAGCNAGAVAWPYDTEPLFAQPGPPARAYWHPFRQAAPAVGPQVLCSATDRLSAGDPGPTHLAAAAGIAEVPPDDAFVGLHQDEVAVLADVHRPSPNWPPHDNAGRSRERGSTTSGEVVDPSGEKHCACPLLPAHSLASNTHGGRLWQEYRMWGTRPPTQRVSVVPDGQRSLGERIRASGSHGSARPTKDAGGQCPAVWPPSTGRMAPVTKGAFSR